MSNNALIATRSILAIDSSGREFALMIGVGQPYEVSSEEWACPVRMDGMHGRLHDQHGVDSWQAMQLAYQLVAQLLGYFIGEGGRLLWPESREQMALEELIPHIKS